MSYEYKMVCGKNDHTCGILTIWEGRGWGRNRNRHQSCPDSERGSPITIDGFMYSLLIWVKQRFRNADALICLDLESEQWKADMIKGFFFISFFKSDLKKLKEKSILPPSCVLLSLISISLCFTLQHLAKQHTPMNKNVTLGKAAVHVTGL
jgi:hypothetical protein